MIEDVEYYPDCMYMDLAVFTELCLSVESDQSLT